MPLRILLVVALGLVLSCQQTEHTTSNNGTKTDIDISLYPSPKAIDIPFDSLDISHGIYVSPAVAKDSMTRSILQVFVDRLSVSNITTSDARGAKLTTAVIPNKLAESYNLEIRPSGIHIKAGDDRGLRYGLQTLGQILLVHSSYKIPGYRVKDEPVYGERGLYLDAVSHWFPVASLEELINSMGIARLNKLYLQIGGDQAWRVESNTFPRLHMMSRQGEHYSVSDINHLRKWGERHGVEIIPSIDLPGKVGAMVGAYPELGFSENSKLPYTSYGIHKTIIDPLKPNTKKFISSIISELTELFDADEIHLGGVDVRYDLWLEDEEVASFMKDNEIENPSQLHGYFTIQLHEIVKDLNKKMILWDGAFRPEIQPSDHLTYMVNTNHSSLYGIANTGRDVISSINWQLDKGASSLQLYKTSLSQPTPLFTTAPDTSNFLMYSLTGEIASEQTNGVVIIYGEDPNDLDALVVFNDQLFGFEGIKLEGSIIHLRDGSSPLVANIRIDENDQLMGRLALAGLALDVSGEKVGGTDMPDGVRRPNLPSAPPLEKSDRIIGGTAVVSTEWIDEQVLSSKIWPRAAAIGERLWADMSGDRKRLLDRVSSYYTYTTSLGVLNNDMITSLVEEHPDASDQSSLQIFLHTLEEVKWNKRFADNMDHDVDSALDNLADYIPVESLSTTEFGIMVDRLIQDGADEELSWDINSTLLQWIPIYSAIKGDVQKSRHLKDVEVLALSLSDLSKIASHVMASGSLDKEEEAYYERLKSNAIREIEGVYLAPARHLIKLIDSYRYVL